MIIKKTLSLIIFFAFFILTSISPIFGAIPIAGNAFDVSVSVEKPIPEVITSTQIVSVDFSQPKTIYYKKITPITIDYQKGTYSVYGKEYPIIVDGATWNDVKSSVTGTQDFAHLSYSRFEAYINLSYYAGREIAIQDYLDKLNSRFSEMEAQTDWGTEKFYGKKLNIYIFDGASSCAAGWAIPGEAHIGLHALFPNPNICKNPYYIGGISLFNNQGELEDQWIYWNKGLHETMHAINPLPIYDRPWLTEGLSEYYSFNILANYTNGSYPTDINQETADYYLKYANFSWQFGSFNEYSLNNYMDKLNAEIQSSPGYDITAWMFSMMRDRSINSLNWSKFYQIMENNPETMDQALVLKTISPYYIDTHIIDLFGKASGLTFNQTKAIWRYDGPSGPGWGVRNWNDVNGVIDWYADLTPSLSFSNNNPYDGQIVQLNARVYNNGDTSLNGVSVRFYNGTNLLNEQFVNVSAHSYTNVSSNFAPHQGTYNLKVKVDENNLKIESNEANNEDEKSLTFAPTTCGDLDHSGAIDVLDVVKMINVAFRGGAQGDPAWIWDVDNSGSIDIIDVVKIIGVAFRGTDPITSLSCNNPVPYVQASATITIQKTSDGFSASSSLDRNVAGMQFDLTYDPAKISINKVNPTARTSDMTITNTKISSGKNRIAFYSSDGTSYIKSGSGTLFTVQASGNDFSSLKITPKVVDYKTSNAFNNVKADIKFNTLAKTTTPLY